MDLNHVVLSGLIVAPPEQRTDHRGNRSRRLLVSVRTDDPRRLDVVRVRQFDHPLDEEVEAGDRVVVIGRLERGFADVPTGLDNRIDVVASSLESHQPVCLCR